jgi:8-oxo-dGTP diphosphatase
MTEASHGRWNGWPRAAASAAIFRGGEILLVERGKGPRRGIWSLPGGHIEPGETARTAALRELDEETGVSAELAGLVDVHDVIVHGDGGRLDAHYVLTVYWGRWMSGDPRAGSDSADARFVPMSAIGGYALTHGAAALIRRAYQLEGG